MEIQICSDLHLEFANNRDWLKKHPLTPKAEILVIAGDTYYLNKDYTKLDFIQQVSNDFDQVYLIPGNHEYYDGFDAVSALTEMKKEILPNVAMINNSIVEYGDIQLIFSTMWSTIHQNVLAIKRGMMDFHKIKMNNKPLSITQFNQLHQAAFQFIHKAVKTTSTKKIIITHHLPSLACNAPQFKGSLLNDAFCVDKTDFILNNQIDYWIYGHSHRNLDDFSISNTQMVTNQFGYVGSNEQHTFDYSKVIEI
jgi:predicted phosphodiesterase